MTNDLAEIESEKSKSSNVEIINFVTIWFRFIEKNMWWIASVGGILFILPGISYEWALLREFNINFFDYYTVDDFILSPFKNFKIFFICLILIILATLFTFIIIILGIYAPKFARIVFDTDLIIKITKTPLSKKKFILDLAQKYFRGFNYFVPIFQVLAVIFSISSYLSQQFTQELQADIRRIVGAIHPNSISDKNNGKKEIERSGLVPDNFLDLLPRREFAFYNLTTSRPISNRNNLILIGNSGDFLFFYDPEASEDGSINDENIGSKPQQDLDEDDLVPRNQRVAVAIPINTISRLVLSNGPLGLKQTKPWSSSTDSNPENSKPVLHIHFSGEECIFSEAKISCLSREDPERAKAVDKILELLQGLKLPTSITSPISKQIDSLRGIIEQASLSSTERIIVIETVANACGATDFKNFELVSIGNPIKFDTESSEINNGQEIQTLMTAIIDAMPIDERRQSGRRVIIVGYADQRGPRAYNLDLSEKRAEAVFGRLAELGMPPTLMEIEAVGESHDLPTTNPKLDENRRVVIYDCN